MMSHAVDDVLFFFLEQLGVGNLVFLAVAEGSYKPTAFLISSIIGEALTDLPWLKI